MSPLKARRIPILLLLLAILGAMVELLYSPHRLRLAIGAWHLTHTTKDFDVDPAEPSTMWRFSTPNLQPDTGRFETAVATVAAIDARHNQIPEPAHAMLDDPDSSLNAVLAGRQLHCYNVDLATARLLGAKHIACRMWDMDGLDGLGGNGHNLLEVWDSQMRQWLAFDPYYRCYFTRDSSHVPLSFLNVRQLALTQPSVLHVQDFLPAAPSRPGPEIIEEYRELSPMSSVHTNNDFRWRYDHRYGILQPLSFLFDRLPLKYARGVRTLMIGGSDVRIVLSDSYTPAYGFRSVSLAFRLLLAAAVALLALDVFLGIRERRRRRHPSR